MNTNQTSIATGVGAPRSGICRDMKRTRWVPLASHVTACDSTQVGEAPAQISMALGHPVTRPCMPHQGTLAGSQHPHASGAPGDSLNPAVSPVRTLYLTHETMFCYCPDTQRPIEIDRVGEFVWGVNSLQCEGPCPKSGALGRARLFHGARSQKRLDNGPHGHENKGSIDDECLGQCLGVMVLHHSADRRHSFANFTGQRTNVHPCITEYKTSVGYAQLQLPEQGYETLSSAGDLEQHGCPPTSQATHETCDRILARNVEGKKGGREIGKSDSAVPSASMITNILSICLPLSLLQAGMIHLRSLSYS